MYNHELYFKTQSWNHNNAKLNGFLLSGLGLFPYGKEDFRERLAHGKELHC